MQPQFENDADLVAALLAGVPAAFEQYFHGSYPRLFRFALRRLGRPELAEEIAQEAIIKGLRRLSDFRGEAALLTWLCTICRSEIAMRRRRHPEPEPLQAVLEDDPGVRAALELLADGPAEPEAMAHRAETIALVQSVLDFLPAPYGDALEWKYVDGLTVAELAVRLGRTEKATESLLTRARDAFRRAASDLFAEGVELVRP